MEVRVNAGLKEDVKNMHNNHTRHKNRLSRKKQKNERESVNERDKHIEFDDDVIVINDVEDNKNSKETIPPSSISKTSV